MNILFIANARIPTEKAHGIQIMKMCEALAREGADVSLIVPHLRGNPITTDPFDFYGVERNFRIKKLPAANLPRFGSVGVRIRSVIFACAAFFYSLSARADVVYSREPLPLFLLRLAGKTTALEIHDIPERKLWLYAFLVKHVSFIISTNAWKRDRIREFLPRKNADVLVCPNGIDPEEFAVTESVAEAREKLGLDRKKPIVVYAGQLYNWKGADVLGRAANVMKDALVVFVGGSARECTDFRAVHRADNIIMAGQKPHADIPLYLRAADVAVLPNVPVTRESVYATSPLKLFEYMIAGVPIVASDLPSIREILNERNALLVPPGDAGELARGVTALLRDSDRAKRLAAQAHEDVLRFTWKSRTRAILTFIRGTEEICRL